jgi:hypothetical protein
MIVDIQHDKQIHEFFVNWNLSFSLSFSSCFRECKGIHYAWSLTLIISPCIPAKLFEEYAGYLTELALRKVLPSQRSKSMNSEYWFILKHFVINVWNKQSQLFPSSWLSKLVQDNKQFPTGTLFLHQLSWWIYSSYHYLIFLTLLPQFSLRSAKGRNQLRNNPCIYIIGSGSVEDTRQGLKTTSCRGKMVHSHLMIFSFPILEAILWVSYCGLYCIQMVTP